MLGEMLTWKRSLVMDQQLRILTGTDFSYRAQAAGLHTWWPSCQDYLVTKLVPNQLLVTKTN